MDGKTITETVLAEFYSRDDRRDVQLVKRQADKAPWFVIRYSDVGNILGFNDEAQAREAYRRLAFQAQNP
jgi:hypothetical protein